MNSLQEVLTMLPADDFSFDADIRDIFIEEAVEVLQEMDDHLPCWSDDPNNFQPLTELRRGFHTLKGSGRMVGAFSVGETAWAVENLLNRVLEKKIPISEDLVDFINEAKMTIAYLINDFANSELPKHNPALTILKAENLRLQRDINFDENVSIESEQLDDNDTKDKDVVDEVGSITTTPVVEYDDEQSITTGKTKETVETILPESPVEVPVKDTSTDTITIVDTTDASPNIQDFISQDNLNTTTETNSCCDINNDTSNFPIDDKPNSLNTIDLSHEKPIDEDSPVNSSKSEQPVEKKQDGLLNKYMFFIGLGIGLLILLLLSM